MATDGPTDATSFRRVALVAWIMQALIVLSGAAVRLTQAGLGCEDWPTCNDEQLFPEWQLHGLIEFGNRVISGFVAVSAIVAVVAAYRRVPRRPDLLRYAWGLVAGTLAQVVLGGITVLADLHPIIVSVHFLISMVLLWNAQLLWFHAGRPDHSSGRLPLATWPARLLLTLAGAVLLTGTIVTGTGPNSGDSRADRLGFDLNTVARIHSVCVWVLLATVVAVTVHMARNTNRDPQTFAIARWMVITMAIQGAIGYTQFSLGVPPALVELHILGSIVVWSLAIALFVNIRSSSATSDDGEINRSVPALK